MKVKCNNPDCIDGCIDRLMFGGYAHYVKCMKCGGTGYIDDPNPNLTKQVEVLKARIEKLEKIVSDTNNPTPVKTYHVADRGE